MSFAVGGRQVLDAAQLNQLHIWHEAKKPRPRLLTGRTYNVETPVGKAFKGDLCDISLGGLCFLVRITKRETTRLLLGKNLRLSFVGASGETAKGLDQEGCIVAVRYHPLEDCSIHVRFKIPVTESLIREIKGIDNHHATLI